MTHREQAEELRLALTMGLIDKADVIRWADAVIESEASPAAWVLNVSLSANESKDVVAARLQDAVDGIDVTVHVYLLYRGEPPAFAEQPFGRQEWMIDGSRSPAQADVRVIRESTTAPTAPRPGIVSVEGDRMEHSRAFGDEAPRPATFGEGRAKGYAAMSLSRLK